MTDFQTLTDAFAELERRADTTAATDVLLSAPVRHRSRLPLVAASAVGVLAVTTGVVLAARGGGTRTEAGAPPSSPAAQASTAAATFRIPRTPDELAHRFSVVLGDTATFTVTDTGTPVMLTAPPAPTRSGANVPVRSMSATPNGAASSTMSPTPNGAAIIGTLTAGGTTGGFDLQILRASDGTRASCDDPDRSRCTERRLADGSSLAVGHERLPGSSTGVTYQVDLVRADGVEFLMHVSNERSPKGASTVLAAHPPLTTEQMTAIVTSDRW